MESAGGEPAGIREAKTASEVRAARVASKILPLTRETTAAQPGVGWSRHIP